MPPADPTEDTTAWFSVIESVEDKVIDRIATVLEADPRILHISDEQGRYYSNPDRDDLPEWFALRCECHRDSIVEIMADVPRLIEDKLGKEAAARVQISRY